MTTASASPPAPNRPTPWGSCFGDVTWARIVRGGLARIECRRISSRWARTAQVGMDFVALGSHYASRTRRAPVRFVLARSVPESAHPCSRPPGRRSRVLHVRARPRCASGPALGSIEGEFHPIQSRPRLLRLFPSATPPHPPLRSFFSYSEGSRGVVDGTRRSRRSDAASCGSRGPRGRGARGAAPISDPAPSCPSPSSPDRRDTAPRDLTDLTGAAGTGLRNASPARRSPPHLAPCEPSATKSACTRSAPAHLAQCEPR